MKLGGRSPGTGRSLELFPYIKINILIISYYFECVQLKEVETLIRVGKMNHPASLRMV